ncbi:site-specific DNA-methyltransferase [Moraxella veridica]|uniref:site-specific DNA-methyltransferase n=1 Tax=Moraxella veridica TaxID=3344666 RepID=UPI002161B988|nr:site-specific DNA-methyltransferase [Moraxella catarrhalis]
MFSQSFQAKLLGGFDELDNQIDGTIIHSDNFQALNLLQAKYQGQVKCIYIDPPYNTEDDREKGDFLYKDSFAQSTWLSMFENRLQLSRNLLNYNGLLACHMDEHEHLSLEYVIKQMFGSGDMGKLIWDKRNPKGDAKGLSAQHEYVHFATNNINHLDDETAFVRNKANAELMLDKVEKLIKKYGITEKTREKYKEWIKENKDKLSGGEKAYNQIDDNGDIFRPVSMAWPNKKTAPDDYFIPLIHPITGKPCPVPARGWRNPPTTMQKLLEKDLILFGQDESIIPNRKYLLKENLTENVSSLYYMGSSDDELFKNMGFSFDNPKPIQASKYFLSIIARPQNSLILDYFAGSGTTAHAVINLNREDGGNRKFILVEQGEYFDTVLKPRIQKVIFAKDYKDGKPVADKDGQFGGISQIVKVLKLESYEDTLNNLVLKPKDLAGLGEQTQNDYVLNYMLDIESRESLLNVADFAKPFDYQLDITTNSAGASVRQKIDLVETFNYLIGATVLGIDDRRDGKGYVEIECRLPRQNDDERTLIFWRDCDKLGYDELKAMFVARNINPRESIYQEIYINGDHTLDTVWESADSVQSTLKVKSIEQEFLTLMFGAI